MKVVYLHTFNTAVSDYRIWAPARAMRKRGHGVYFVADEDPAVEGDEAVLLRAARDYDLIHTGYSYDLNYLRNLAAVRNYALQVYGKQLPIVMDCDDDIMNVPPYNLAFKHFNTDAKRQVLWGFKNADALTVTMPHLQKLYSPFSKNVGLLPNCIEPEAWAGWEADPRLAQSEDVRVVFAGGVGRKGDLDEIRDAIEIVMRNRPQVRLFFMGMMPDWVQEQWASDAGDPKANRAFFLGAGDHYLYRQAMNWVAPHIVIAPVAHNDFNRGKSEIKVMEGAMFGAASVCSDWDTYAAVPNECVLKAETTYEWKESLLALIDDPELRRKKASKCKEWVLAERAIDKNIHLWEDFYTRVLAQPVIDTDGRGIKDVGVGASDADCHVKPDAC